jgi:hypothetical protein
VINDSSFTLKSSVMKKSAFISIAIGIALLVGISVVLFMPAREPVSLTFLQYMTSRDVAKLKLTNNSGKTITYLTDQHGGAVLALANTPTGWTNSLPEIVSGGTTDPATGKTIPAYFSGDPGFMTNGSLAPFELLHIDKLKPGQSAELYAWLQADGSPTRAGTVCIVPQGKLAQQFGRWINRVKGWCHMKSTPSGQFEVWCNEPLQVSSSQLIK